MATSFGNVLLLTISIIQTTSQVKMTRDRHGTHSYQVLEQCPLSCRCSQIDPGHSLYRKWESIISSTSNRFVENVHGYDNAFSRRTSGTDVFRRNSRRGMECIGLRSFPKAIPPDVIRLSVLGELKEPLDGAGLHEDGQRPSSLIAPERPPATITNQLSKIDKHSFRQSRDLIELSIVRNNIGQISAREFENLPNLISLNLEKNNLTSVHENSFRSLYQLEELRLSENHIRYLPKNVFLGLRNLRKLFLEKNSLQAVLLKTLGPLTKLEILDLSANNLTYLSKSVFVRHRRLRELNLADNKLQAVRTQWFVRHNLDRHHIKKLFLDRNKISSLLLGSFSSFTALTDLSLSGNDISIIHPESFSNLKNMRVLDLSGNKLQSIVPGTFMGTAKLTELRLANNQLKTIENSTFDETSSVQILDLSGNKFGEIAPENFQNLRSLKKLDLSSNRIAVLRNGTFFGLRSLRELNLANNRIGEVEDFSLAVSLSRYTSQLTWLNLEHNQLSLISSGTFRSVPHLKFLNLAYSKIRSINQDSFRSQRQLITLLLNNNDILQLPGGLFVATKNLRNLNLAKNKLNHLTGSSLEGLRALDELNVHGNHLTSVTRDVLQKTPSLQRANFSRNFLKRFDMSSIEIVFSLTHLDLSGNGLSDLQVRKGAKIGLKYLSLAHNELKTLNGDITNFMAPNGILGLRDNRWTCNCELSWIRNLVPIWQIRLENANVLVCSHPLPLANRRILSLRQTEFRCGVNNVHLHYRDTVGSPANRPPVWERRNLSPSLPRGTQAPALSARRYRDRYEVTTTPRYLFAIEQLTRRQTPDIGRFTRLPHPSVDMFTRRPPPDIEKFTIRPPTIERFTRRPPPIELFTRRPQPIDKFTRRPPPIEKSTRRSTTTESFTRQPPPIRRFTRRPPVDIGRHTRRPLPGRSNSSYNVIPRVTMARNETKSQRTGNPNSINGRAKYDKRRKQRGSRIGLVGKVRAIQPMPNLITKATVAPMPANSYHTSFRRTTSKVPTNVDRLFRRGRFKDESPRTNSKKTFRPKPTVATTIIPRGIRRPNISSKPSNQERLTTTSPLWINFPTFRLVDSKHIRRTTKFTTSTARNPFLPWRPRATSGPDADVRDRDNIVAPRTTQNPSLPGFFATTQRYRDRTTPRTDAFAKGSSLRSKKYPVVHSRPKTERPYKLTLPPPFPRNPPYSRTTTVPRNIPLRPNYTGRQKTRLECPHESQFRLDFDTKLIRKHKSEVKNYHVTIMSSKRRPACNGVLLSDWWVLTTASCVEKNLANRRKLTDKSWTPKYHVKIGFRELNQVIQIVIHPIYLSRITESHDFAMLKLRYESLMTKVVTPPCVMPPERFQSRPAWIVPGVVSARLGNKVKRSSLQSLAVKVWEGNCKAKPASCLRLLDTTVFGSSTFTEGIPLYLGYSKTRWGLVGIGSPGTAETINQFTPTWTILHWLENIVDS